VRIARDALVELRDKYAEMLAMRVAHAAGPEDVAQVRARMGRLAARFPGALREIDALELSEIRSRIEAIDRVLARTARAEPWMEAITLFHAMARGALAVKRWLGGRKRVDAALVRRLEQEAGALPFPEDARAWAAELAHVASPPRGRVTDAVFARLARTLQTSERAARRMVFGAPRRERER
jgi:hypothetical protein